MDWLQILTLIIEAVSALTTVAAVLVALYQTKYADRIRLKIHYNYETSRKTKEDVEYIDAKCINIEIINLSSREVVFDYIKIYANRKYYCEINRGFSGHFCYINNKELVSNKNFHIKLYLFDIKQILIGVKKNVKLKRNLVFIVKTLSGKTVKIRTNLKIKKLLNTSDEELIPKLKKLSEDR